MIEFPKPWLLTWKNERIPKVLDKDSGEEVLCPHIPMSLDRHTNWVAAFSGQRVKRPQITLQKVSDPIHYSASGQYCWSGRINIVIGLTGEMRRGYYKFYNNTKIVFQTSSAVALSIKDYNEMLQTIKQAEFVLNNLRYKP